MWRSSSYLRSADHSPNQTLASAASGARISLDPPRTIGYRIGARILRRIFGQVLDPFKVQAHNMPVALALNKLEGSVARKWTTLDTPLKHLAVFAAAVNMGCPWCVDIVYWQLRAAGVPRGKFEAIQRGQASKLLTPREAAAVEYAQAMTDTPPTVTDEIFSELRTHFTDPQLVELTAVIALENLRSRFNAAFGLASQGFSEKCDLPVSPQGTWNPPVQAGVAHGK